ncbi:thiol reductase thioredoxin [Paenibacillus selenitireducens]|uniref:Thioredoxin n=1 Tax=Paenibacillus selenitireducens TaxID=1324314 RepID=A0A1T2XCT4_9BACL|nr:thioredoxin domain-containing protein [Paenibacillus selenitireducens]OPA77699.1 thiol reductase thioredoxin [Paenibacillus selenitireducens]
MSIISVNDATLKEHILSTGVTIIDFGAVWCPPCKVLLPILEDLNKTYGEQIRILKVDVDESPASTAQYGVQSIPTVFILRHGTPMEKFIGLRPKSAYSQVIQQFL